MTLYELTGAAAALHDMVDAGDIDEQTFEDTLEGMGVEGKLEDYGKVIATFNAEIAAYKAERDRFAEKIRNAENAIDRMKNRVTEYMNAAGMSKAPAGVFTVYARQTPVVCIKEPGEIPERFLKYKEPTFDKVAIKKAIAGGETVPGAELETSTSISFK